MNRYVAKIIEAGMYYPIQILGAVYRLKNRNKTKLFIYTDSRGFFVSSYIGRRNPFYKSYVKYFIKNYHVTFRICPEFSTTTLDFLQCYQQTSRDFDIVILHTGLVDYSIRPVEMIEKMEVDKSSAIASILPTATGLRRDNSCLELYYGKECNRFIDFDTYTKFVLPEIDNIPNLIWVGMNQVVSNWSGNYPRERPSRLNENMELDAFLAKRYPGYISLNNWNDSEVKRFTVDNIHLSTAGFKEIENRIKEKLDNVSC